MSKKNKKYRGAFNSLKTFGGRGTAAAKLATTVKADAPTFLVGKSAKDSGSVSALHRLSMKLSPFAAKGDRKAAKNLKRLAQEMRDNAKPKKRRSRLPYLIIVLLGLFAYGGYKAVEMISMPKFSVSDYVDYNKWLALVSGQVKPPIHKQANASGSAVKPGPSKKIYSSPGAVGGRKGGKYASPSKGKSGKVKSTASSRGKPKVSASKPKIRSSKGAVGKSSPRYVKKDVKKHGKKAASSQAKRSSAKKSSSKQTARR